MPPNSSNKGTVRRRTREVNNGNPSSSSANNNMQNQLLSSSSSTNTSTNNNNNNNNNFLDRLRGLFLESNQQAVDPPMNDENHHSAAPASSRLLHHSHQTVNNNQQQQQPHQINNQTNIQQRQSSPSPPQSGDDVFADRSALRQAPDGASRDQSSSCSSASIFEKQTSNNLSSENNMTTLVAQNNEDAATTTSNELKETAVSQNDNNNNNNSITNNKSLSADSAPSNKQQQQQQQPTVPQNWIELNVGGTSMITLRETFLNPKIQDSDLALLALNNFSSLPKDAENRPFFDVEPKVFRHVLNYLRGYPVSCLGVEAGLVGEFASTYGLVDLEQKLGTNNSAYSHKALPRFLHGGGVSADGMVLSPHLMVGFNSRPLPHRHGGHRMVYSIDKLNPNSEFAIGVASADLLHSYGGGPRNLNNHFSVFDGMMNSSSSDAAAATAIAKGSINSTHVINSIVSGKHSVMILNTGDVLSCHRSNQFRKGKNEPGIVRSTTVDNKYDDAGNGKIASNILISKNRTPKEPVDEHRQVFREGDFIEICVNYLKTPFFDKDQAAKRFSENFDRDEDVVENYPLRRDEDEDEDDEVKNDDDDDDDDEEDETNNKDCDILSTKADNGKGENNNNTNDDDAALSDNDDDERKRNKFIQKRKLKHYVPAKLRGTALDFASQGLKQFNKKTEKDKKKMQETHQQGKDHRSSDDDFDDDDMFDDNSSDDETEWKNNDNHGNAAESSSSSLSAAAMGVMITISRLRANCAVKPPPANQPVRPNAETQYESPHAITYFDQRFKAVKLFNAVYTNKEFVQDADLHFAVVQHAPTKDALTSVSIDYAGHCYPEQVERDYEKLSSEHHSNNDDEGDNENVAEYDNNGEKIIKKKNSNNNKNGSGGDAEEDESLSEMLLSDPIFNGPLAEKERERNKTSLDEFDSSMVVSKDGNNNMNNNKPRPRLPQASVPFVNALCNQQGLVDRGGSRIMVIPRCISWKKVVVSRDLKQYIQEYRLVALNKAHIQNKLKNKILPPGEVEPSISATNFRNG